MTTLRNTCLAAALLAASFGSLAAADPALKDLPLTAVKASVRIPETWHVREDNEDGVIVYQITREKISEDGATFLVGFTLTVTPDVPGRAMMSPSKYAAELLSFSVEDGGKVDTTLKDPFQILRTEYSVEGDTGAVKIVDVATANDKTGTLYFFAWQNPEAESEAVSKLREEVISSLKFDSSF
jgi:hypothetical protein